VGCEGEEAERTVNGEGRVESVGEVRRWRRGPRSLGKSGSAQVLQWLESNFISRSNREDRNKKDARSGPYPSEPRLVARELGPRRICPFKLSRLACESSRFTLSRV
jgi:hypothetical protein